MPSRQLHVRYNLADDILAKTGWAEKGFTPHTDTPAEDASGYQDVISDPKRALDLDTLAAGSMPDDPKIRADFYAQKAFPDLYKKNPQAARDRIGVQQGRYYYVPENEKRAYWVAADLPKHAPLLPEVGPSGARQQLATQVGPALPAVGGMIGGAATMEAGPVGSMAGASVGGATGQQLRQTLSHLLTGEDKPIGEQLQSDVTEGVKSAIGQAGGVYGGRAVGYLARPVMRRIPGHPFYDKTYDPAAVKTAEDKAFAISNPQNPIELWPAMKSDDPKLKELTAGALATNEAVNVSQAAMAKMNGQVRDAVESYLGQLSDTTSAHQAARQGTMAAHGVLDSIKGAREAAAQPFYKQAEKQSADITPFVRDLLYEVDPGNVSRLSGATQKAIVGNKITQDPQGLGTVVTGANVLPYSQAVSDEAAGLMDEAFNGPWKASQVPFQRIDFFKKRLDDLIAKAKRGAESGSNLGGTQYQELLRLKKKFTDVVDPQLPMYRAGRAEFQAGSGPLEQHQESLVGDLSKVDEQDSFRAMKRIFNPENSSPEDIALARTAFTNAGEDQGWRDLVKSYLQNEFEKAAKEPSGQIYNLGAAFRQNVIGNDKKRKMLMAALDDNPVLLQRMNWIIDTMDSISRIPAPTRDVWARQAADEFARYVRSNPGTRLMDLYSNVAGVVTGARSISEIAATGLSEASRARSAQNLAQKLTDPNMLTWFPDVYQLSPRSALAMALVGQMMLRSDAQDPDQAAPARGN